MYFRSVRKRAGEVSLSEPIDSDKDGNALSLMDVISCDDTMLDDIEYDESRARLYKYLFSHLEPREREIVIARYGLYGREPMTQREIAAAHGISRSYQANQLYDFMRTRGDSMIAIVATSRPDVWKKAVRARYPVYTADDTELKELARGEAALVYVSDDTIRWKTSLTAISPELLNGDSAEVSANALLNRTSGDNTLRVLTSIYAGMMLLTLILGIWPEQGRFWRRVRL